jgi:hypothetical protein
MASLRMNTRDVIGTGFSFLFVIIVLHIIVGILNIIGFVLFTQLGEDGDYGVWEPSTASWILGLLFWIPSGIILICGYIGLWTKLLTDSIAVGVYKANTADDDADVEVKVPWGDGEPQSQPPQSELTIVAPRSAAPEIDTPAPATTAAPAPQAHPPTP